MGTLHVCYLLVVDIKFPHLTLTLHKTLTNTMSAVSESFWATVLLLRDFWMRFALAKITSAYDKRIAEKITKWYTNTPMRYCLSHKYATTNTNPPVSSDSVVVAVADVLPLSDNLVFLAILWKSSAVWVNSWLISISARLGPAAASIALLLVNSNVDMNAHAQ